MDRDWIRLYRALLEHPVFQDADLLKLFIWCILKANFKPSRFHDQLIGVGQFVTGRNRGAEEVGISPSKWYRDIERLSRPPFSCISVKADSNWTTITVCKYTTYQKAVGKTEQQVDSKWTASEQQVDTIEERTTEGSSSKTGRRKDGKKDSCGEPAKPTSPPPSTDSTIMVFPCVGKGPTEWPLTAAKLAEYSEAFPDLDLPAEMRAARQWCIDNRTKRKTFCGMPAFLSRWLTKSQNEGRARPLLGGRNFDDPRGNIARMNRQLEELANGKG